MAKSTVRNVELDPRFYIPEGVIDVRQSNKQNSDYVYDTSVIASEGPTLLTPESSIPMPPTSVSVYSQRVRIGADGQTTIQVVLEFPEVDGIEDVEVRITPA